MKRTRLKSKDVNKQLEKYQLNLSKKDQVELIQNGQKLIIINKVPTFFYYQEQIVPTLKYLQTHLILKKIIVDQGAVKFVINGADIMRPGIKEIEDNIQENEFIVIVDETHQKPLAVGIATLNSEDLKKVNSGKVIKNIHYVGDELWKTEFLK